MVVAERLVAHGEQGHERVPRGDHRQAHNEAHQRHQHGKAPGVGHAALNFAAADGFADHDDAGVAEADEEGEGKLGKRLEDGHAGVIFIAHVGINAVEHEHTERPQAFVRHDGQCAGAELAELLQVEVKQLPHRADQQVFLKRREDQNQHRPQARTKCTLRWPRPLRRAAAGRTRRRSGHSPQRRWRWS